MNLMHKIRNFYGRFEWPISSLSLIAGFTFDALTLRRADTFWENFWIIGHLVIIAIFILLIHLTKGGPGDEKDPHKAHFWYVNILQFFFGGILSAYIVFYFHSTDIWNTWPFVMILFFAFMANESFKRHYIRFSFQMSLFFLSVYSLMIFLVPVVLHKIGTPVFILSGLLSLAITSVFAALIYSFSKRKEVKSEKLTMFMIGGIFILVNVLYFTNLMPPLPLSLRDSGVYHLLERQRDGSYLAAYEDGGWRQYLSFYPTFSSVGNSPVYLYTAVFSPAGLNLKIIHEWQHYDEKSKAWVTDTTMPLNIVGGRDEGFRTFSVRTNLAPGLWRVNIKTANNKMIGQVRFDLVPSTVQPRLYAEIK